MSTCCCINSASHHQTLIKEFIISSNSLTESKSKMPVHFNNPPLFQCYTHHYLCIQCVLSDTIILFLISFHFLAFSYNTPKSLLPSTLPDVWPSDHLPRSCPHHRTWLFISVLLSVLLSAAVIITSSSSSSFFASANLSDSKPAALHAAANGYLINLSLQVQLGQSDKLGNLRCSVLLSVYKMGKQAVGRWTAGIGRVSEWQA